ncbi:MAG: DUF6443 domain-containing protein, partial [Candidatus Micrarchaeota archaeon]
GYDDCIITSPTKIVSYGTLGKGYFSMALDEIGNYFDDGKAVQTTLETEFNRCGNPIGVTMESYYKHPFYDLAPSEPFNKFLSLYKKTVESDFGPYGEFIGPVSVTTYGPPDLTAEAAYYLPPLIQKVKNERGVETTYDYDDLGRLAQLIAWPDSSDYPTAIYEYSSGSPGMAIHEKRKLDPENAPNSRYIEAWHFYDGMGRWMQTQVKDGDEMTITSSEYDVLGRVTLQYRPIKVPSEESFGVYQPSPMDGNFRVPTYLSYEYDALNRVTSITDSADSSVITKKYTYENGFGADLEKTSVEDPNNNIRDYYSDAKGGLVAVTLPTPTP